MRLHRVAQRVFLIDRDLDGSFADDVKEIVGDGEEVLALGRIGVERRSCRVERALGLQNVDIERVALSRRTAKTHKHPERPQAIERGRECGLADPVVDHLTQFTSSYFFYAHCEVFATVS